MTQNIGRPLGATMEHVKARTEEIIGLKNAGMSPDTILRTINERAKIKGWGTITMKSMMSAISAYYRENVPLLSKEDADYAANLRRAHLSSMEKTIEEMAKEIKLKENWKSFERADAISKLYEMQESFANIEGWSRMAAITNNLTVNFNQKIEEFEAVGRLDSLNSDEKKRAVVELLNGIIEVKQKEEEMRDAQRELEEIKLITESQLVSEAEVVEQPEEAEVVGTVETIQEEKQEEQPVQNNTDIL